MAKSIRAAVLSVIALGCISPTEPQTCGTFAGRAGGASTDSLSGCAIFTIDPDNGAFGLLLTHGAIPNFDPSVRIVRDAGRPDAPATYPVGPAGCGHTNLCGVVLLDQRLFQLSGTLVVTQTDTLGFRGSLDAVGTDSLGTTLTIRGAFTAECKGQKKPFEVQGDPNNNTERYTPCKPFIGRG